MSNFFTLSEEQRKQRYKEMYVKEKKSWGQIAKELKTYPNKVRRDATSLGIKSRDKSKAQKIAIQQGRHEHPTKGKKRKPQTLRKISESQGKVWDNLTESERKYRSQIGVDAWNNKTDKEKAEFLKKGGEAVQEASRHGSKAENHVYRFLIDQGYRVDKHKEQILQNEKFHLDLYVPAVRTAIEVDGPLHFKPVFGKEKLQKRQAADSMKNGLILSSGMVLIRVKLDKRESQRYFRYLTNEILKIIRKVEERFPDPEERLFEI